MDICDIKNPALAALVRNAEANGAPGIEADLEFALYESSTDEELIKNWQGKLINRYREVQDYFNGLERIKKSKRCIGEAVAEKEAHENIFCPRCGVAVEEGAEVCIVCKLPVAEFPDAVRIIKQDERNRRKQTKRARK